MNWGKKSFCRCTFFPPSFNTSHLCALMISINRNHSESDMGMMNKHEMNVISLWGVRASFFFSLSRLLLRRELGCCFQCVIFIFFIEWDHYIAWKPLSTYLHLMDCFNMKTKASEMYVNEFLMRPKELNSVFRTVSSLWG